MADFSAEVALAQELIAANGRSVSLVQLAKAAANPALPWRGPANARTPALRTVTGKACFVPLGGSSLGIEFPDAAPGSQVCLYPAAEDQGQPLEDFDEIIDGAERWAIASVQVLQPAEQRILYYFLVQK